MNIRVRCIVIAACLLLPLAAHAHFIWAVFDPIRKIVRIEVAESPGKDIAPILGMFLPAIKTQGLGQLTAESDRRSISAPWKEGSAPTVNLTYGLHGTDLVKWWAKAATNLKACATPKHEAYEMLIRQDSHGFIARVLRRGKGVSQAKVEAYLAGAPIGSELTTDRNGDVKIPAAKNGLLAIGAIVVEPGGGDYNGKAFQSTMVLVSATVPLD